MEADLRDDRGPDQATTAHDSPAPFVFSAAATRALETLGSVPGTAEIDDLIGQASNFPIATNIRSRVDEG